MNTLIFHIFNSFASHLMLTPGAEEDVVIELVPAAVVSTRGNQKSLQHNIAMSNSI